MSLTSCNVYFWRSLEIRALVAYNIVIIRRYDWNKLIGFLFFITSSTCSIWARRRHSRGILPTGTRCRHDANRRSANRKLCIFRHARRCRLFHWNQYYIIANPYFERRVQTVLRVLLLPSDENGFHDHAERRFDGQIQHETCCVRSDHADYRTVQLKTIEQHTRIPIRKYSAGTVQTNNNNRVQFEVDPTSKSHAAIFATETKTSTVHTVARSMRVQTASASILCVSANSDNVFSPGAQSRHLRHRVRFDF